MFLSSLLYLVSLTTAAASYCGQDLQCLVKSSQYTILGEVKSLSIDNNLNTNPNQTYNATINIKCMYSSFSRPPNQGDDLVGRDITVMSFNITNRRCNPIAKATVGDTRFFFISINEIAPRGTPTIFAIVDICIGGLEKTDSNSQELSDLLAQNPNNVIPSQNVGPSPLCSLPAPIKIDLPPGDSSESGAFTTMWYGSALTILLMFLIII